LIWHLMLVSQIQLLKLFFLKLLFHMLELLILWIPHFTIYFLSQFQHSWKRWSVELSKQTWLQVLLLSFKLYFRKTWLRVI